MIEMIGNSGLIQFPNITVWQTCSNTHRLRPGPTQLACIEKAVLRRHVLGRQGELMNREG
jgi:hypothetical protein